MPALVLTICRELIETMEIGERHGMSLEDHHSVVFRERQGMPSQALQYGLHETASGGARVCAPYGRDRC